jgi:hypothetical protein
MDSCSIQVQYGSLLPGSTVTFAVSVNTTGSNTSVSPMSCGAGAADTVQSSGANSCTFGLPSGASGGNNVGTQTFRAPFSSAPDGAVHEVAMVVEQNQAFSLTVSISGPGAFVSPDPAPTLSVDNLTMTEGQNFNGQVATFSDPESTTATSDGSVCAATCPPPSFSEYFATIDWGDGTANAQPASISGSSVSASHVYAEEGSYTVTVTLQDADTSSNRVATSGGASVSDAAVTATGATIHSPNPLSGTVASFSDADPNGTVADYTARIDWGDGSSSSGTITQDGSHFDVSGDSSHPYANLGPYSVTVTVCDVGGSCAAATSQVLIYGLSIGGNFVVGDVNAASGGAVTFWGAGWAAANTPSGGPTPADFKGFADTPNGPPICGNGWSTTPGNSARPPVTVPTYMAVLVSSSISQDRAHISGDAPEVVVIKTDPGYGPDPSQPGTGTVVAVLCP